MKPLNRALLEALVEAAPPAPQLLAPLFELLTEIINDIAREHGIARVHVAGAMIVQGAQEIAKLNGIGVASMLLDAARRDLEEARPDEAAAATAKLKTRN